MSFTLNNIAITATTTSASDLTAVAAAINGAAGSTQVTASFEGTDKSKIKLTTTAGENISLSAFTLGTSTIVVTPAGGTGAVTLASGGSNSTVVTGEVKILSTRGVITAANGEANVFSGASNQSSFTSVSGLSLTTAASSNSALSVLDEALTQVNNTRASLGGLMNRFSASVSNQTTTIANLSASRSRILDTDYAVETTNLAKAQIIQQAATAMLAQANQSQQSVLALLK
jgi:flagellin